MEQRFDHNSVDKFTLINTYCSYWLVFLWNPLPKPKHDIMLIHKIILDIVTFTYDKSSNCNRYIFLYGDNNCVMREKKDVIVKAASKRTGYTHKVLYILEVQFDKTGKLRLNVWR